ncbi:MAG: hypothetical protein ACI9O3_000882 [Colwellia sp.]|jgi:hypothetical protein
MIFISYTLYLHYISLQVMFSYGAITIDKLNVNIKVLYIDDQYFDWCVFYYIVKKIKKLR